MVEWIFAWVTAVLVAPGVRDRFGKIAPAALITIPPEPLPGWLVERFGVASVLEVGVTAAGVALSTGVCASDGGAADWHTASQLTVSWT